MQTSELRKKFVDFFVQKGHTFVPSSSIIPIGSQTTLFTIAGMVQFKTALTGEEIRSYKRAANAQKCVRVSDLDNVGKNGRHHTFFEMLGNWSFGDYYKKNAIEWAYEFVRDVVKMDLSNFWVSVHISDNEALEIWKSVGVPEHRIVKLDADNFWKMGPTGPCGPCTELHIDQGIEVGREFHVRNGTKCLEQPGCDCDRFLEFWNLVFMQFDRQEDGTLIELPFKSVDTGAGLERFAALLQGKTSNFEIDSFVSIKTAIRRRALIENDSAVSFEINESLNVVADHTRMLTFCLADGCVFGNEGRGYVMRRVLRRAVRHGHRLNPSLPKDTSFLADIVPSVISEFGEFYPELIEHKKRIIESIRTEELRFSKTLSLGLERFSTFVHELKATHPKVMGGDKIFLLHDSFGFPSDLTRVLCEENGIIPDLKGFDAAMLQQQEKSRADAKFYKFDDDDSPWVTITEGNGKDELNFTGYNIIAPTGIHKESDIYKVNSINIRKVRQLKNRLFEVIIANTPFYAESGGQVNDIGWLHFASNAGITEFEIIDVRKTPAAIVHLLKHTDFSAADIDALDAIKIQGLFSQPASALLDFTHRMNVARNHTGTHLLHKALQLVVGDSVRQAGSLVTSKALRFDFSCPNALTADELLQVEKTVNYNILKNTKVTMHADVEIDKAKSMGAMAIFNEKYDTLVRVVEVDGFSLELCGGTHVPYTGCIGLLKITSEGSVTAGVRRIEAVTGFESLAYTLELKSQLGTLAEEASCAEKDLLKRMQSFKSEIKNGEKNLAVLESRLVNLQISTAINNVIPISTEVNLIAITSQANSVQELELLCDRLKEQNIGVIIVGGAIEGKAVVIAAVNPALTKAHKNLSAGTIVRNLCAHVDGKGGGRADFARGGGNSPHKLPEAFAAAESIVKQLLV